MASPEHGWPRKGGETLSDTFEAYTYVRWNGHVIVEVISTGPGDNFPRLELTVARVLHFSIPSTLGTAIFLTLCYLPFYVWARPSFCGGVRCLVRLL